MTTIANEVLGGGPAWITARMWPSTALAADPKYKKYTQQVEKCLATFDSVHEWPDFIAFLTKLLKTLQSYMQYKEIPRKLIVSKRLSQCLNPALPTGVHQRALDVYSHILAVLGTEGLRRDLHLWSSGLFPFFEYAAISVKPTLLGLYDTYYLALQGALRPIMKAFILALLPGLEEETGEFFDQVLTLLDRLSGTLSPAFFIQNIWLCMLTTPSARAPALQYLSRRLPKLRDDKDISNIVGSDMGLMIRAFASALEDDNLLVRRAILDLLLQSLRLDSPALKKAQPEDRTLLMHAAVDVVLRRDSSLNRRLYTWLLGPDEASEVQTTYLTTHSLELLTSTLKADLIATAQPQDARPFKIFLSLLDKWEIGSQLTEVLILDTLRAIMGLLEERDEGSDDILIAATALYEAIEPNAVWRQLFSTVRDEILGTTQTREGTKLIQFILHTFRVHDEEVQRIHLPICFTAFLELLKAELEESKVSSRSTLGTLVLLSDMLSYMPPTALTSSPQFGTTPTAYVSAYQRAAAAYGLEGTFTARRDGRSLAPLATAAEDLLTIINLFSANTVQSNGFSNDDIFATAATLLGSLLVKSQEKQTKPLEIVWDIRKWLENILSFLDEAKSFIAVDSTISLLVLLHKTKLLEPKLDIDQRGVIGRMVDKVLGYLRGHYVPYHVRAVQRVWDLEGCTTHRHVEAVLARSLSSRDGRVPSDDFDAFGVLWRLSDDALLPGLHFKVPLFIVLDTLQSSDPQLKRTGETWLRTNLKSYTRVLDPLLFDLLDPTILRSRGVVSWQGKDMRTFFYERPFDVNRMNYLVEIMLALFHFGGQGLGRVARMTPTKKAHHPELFSRAQAVKIATGDESYSDLLIEILLRFLQSEPKTALKPTLGPLNSKLQTSSIALVQAIVARGDLDNTSLDAIETTVITKLYSCIHSGRLDLQAKLLHLLHSVILAASTITDVPSRRSRLHIHRRSNDLSTHVSVSADNLHAPENQRKMGGNVNPLLAQTLINGISVQTNRPIFQHWIDFILMTIPQFQPSLQHLVFPLCECICQQLRASVADMERIRQHDWQGKGNIESTITDGEFNMFLHALERLVLQGLLKADTLAAEGLEDLPGSEKASDRATEGTGLLGYVTNVFASDGSTANVDGSLSARSPGYRCLHDAVRILCTVWLSTGTTVPSNLSPEAETILLIQGRTRLRCRKAMERLFRAQSAEVLESLIECWFDDAPTRFQRSNATFELVDILTSSAQTVVHMVCESISYRIAPVTDKTRKLALNPNLTDYVLFFFLEEYFGRLEGPIAMQVWGRFVTLAKEIAGNVYGFKLQVFPCLRCLTTLFEIVCQTAAIDDRKTRREAQDTFSKLMDTCILIAGRSFEQGNWIRRSGAKEPPNGRASPVPKTPSDLTLAEKGVQTPVLAEESTKPVWGPDLVDQINEFMVKKALPNFRRFLADSDKIAALSSNLAYYVVNPATKGRAGQTIDLDETTLDVIKELSKIPAAARAWRPTVADAFNDARFFNCNPEAAQKWRPLVRALVDTDRTVFADLLAKITTGPSANIFTNREHENMIRSLNLRRLSFVLFIGERNHFLAQLPSIQEKLVEILKNPPGAVVQSEVYLCMRVLMCRLSPHNLSSFWPTILTELFRVFAELTISIPAEGSEDLQIVLAASKFLDLLLVLQTQEFQIHQWMFVTDTVDAVYRPEDWSPESLLDQLAELVRDLPEPKVSEAAIGQTITPDILSGILETPGTTRLSNQNLRRPMLASVYRINHIRDLLQFFSTVSITSYESVYGSGSVDWEAVEAALLSEMFEGRTNDELLRE